DIVEKDFAEFFFAGNAVDRSDGDARRLQVDQQEADAMLLLGQLAGADQGKDVGALHRLGGPDLLTVDDEFVAVAYRLGTQRGQVGARTWFGVTLCPDMLAGQDAWQVLALLLFGAELD